MNKSVSDIKRSLFLMQYDVGKDLIKSSLLFESKQTELQALAYMKKSGIDEGVAQKAIERFRDVDSTKNRSLTMPMARAYLELGEDGMSDILATFREVSILVNQLKIPLPQVDYEGFHAGEKIFRNYHQFEEYINNYEHFAKGFEQFKSNIVVDTKAKPIYPRNGMEVETGIVVYDGNDVGRCIQYGLGGLTGKLYGFCIGKPANTNWQTYRDAHGSTFYYVLDKTRSLDDPLHITVIDRQKDGKFDIFDENNTPGKIAKYGEDFDKYISDLRKRGVPVDELFVNKPKTPEEEEEFKKLGRGITDLSRFKNLSYKEKSKYIGRGHTLTNDQFTYLWEYRKNPGVEHLINQYLNMGVALPIEQFKLLTGED